MQNNFYILDPNSADVLCKYRVLILKKRKYSRSVAHHLQSENTCLIQRKIRFLMIRIWVGYKYFDNVEEAQAYLETKSITRLERRGPREGPASPEELTRVPVEEIP